MNSLETALADLKTYSTLVQDTLEGFRFLEAGNSTEADTLVPLHDTVLVYERLTSLVAAAVNALQAVLATAPFTDLPTVEVPTHVIADLDEDHRKEMLARGQIRGIGQVATAATVRFSPAEKKSP